MADYYRDTEERFERDQDFCAAVKLMESIAVTHGFTPGELKQIAFKAALNIEMRTCKTMYDAGDIHAARHLERLNRKRGWRLTFPVSAGLNKARIQARTLWTLDLNGQLAVRCLIGADGVGLDLQWRMHGKWQKPKRANTAHSAGSLLLATAKTIASKMGTT